MILCHVAQMLNKCSVDMWMKNFLERLHAKIFRFLEHLKVNRIIYYKRRLIGQSTGFNL
jgi:hypothetical protein